MAAVGVGTQRSVVPPSQHSQGGGLKYIDFCKQFVAHGEKFTKTPKEDLKQEFVAAVCKQVIKVAEAKKFDRLAKFLIGHSEKDHGVLLSSFADAWFTIAAHQTNTDHLCLIMVKALLVGLPKVKFNFEAFLTLQNRLIALTESASCDFLVEVSSTLSELVKSDTDITVDKRWKDIVHVFVARLYTSKNEGGVTIEGKTSTCKEFAESLLFDWMKCTVSPSIFENITTILSELGSTEKLEEYLDLVLQELKEPKSVLYRKTSSWKILLILQLVHDAKRLTATLRACVLSWKCGEIPNEHLFSVIEITKRVLTDHPHISKSFISLAKSDRGHIFNSEFGFLAYVCLIGIERHRTIVLQDLKRSIARLYRFADECTEVGWLSATKTGAILQNLETQMFFVKERLQVSEEWDLLCEPAMSLAYALLETNQDKKVLVVEGGVSDGPPLWLIASRLLSVAITNRPEKISTHLEPLFRAISLASHNRTSNSALLLIDVLVQVIKKCTLEVLNNSKMIEGLFHWVSSMHRDVAVALTRCLLPVISQRPQLRAGLFKSLKKDMLCENTVRSAVPLLLLLFRSVSQRKSTPLSQGELSQSFATFSSQSYSDMGLKRSVDQVLAMEIVGVLKQCLSQPASTRAALYLGITEVVARNPHISARCLDFLVSHAETVPEWNAKELVSATKNITVRKEALPELIQSLESLVCDTVASIDAGLTQVEGGNNLASAAEEQLSQWVKKSIDSDVHDLDIDKLSEWNQSNPTGRSNLLFAHLIIAVYDALVEHVWRKCYVGTANEDADQLLGLMKRRRELLEVLADKTVRQKETKTGPGDGENTTSEVDLSQTSITTSAKTIAHVLQKVLENGATSSDEPLYNVKEDLLDWALLRAAKLSAQLEEGSHPLHSTQSQTAYLVKIASLLLKFYCGSPECPEWAQNVEFTDSKKSNTIIAYTNIVKYLTMKYRSKVVEKVAVIWQTEVGSGGAIGAMVRHVYSLLSKQYNNLLVMDRDPGDEERDKKKGGAELERQAKTITKFVSFFLSECAESEKAALAITKAVSRVLQHNTFANLGVLRDCLRLFAECLTRTSASTHLNSQMLSAISEQLCEVISGETADGGYQCVEACSQPAVADFLVLVVEKDLAAIRSVVAFANEFLPRNSEMNDLLMSVMERAEISTDFTLKLIQLYTRYGQIKEKIIPLLTNFFTTFEAPVKLLLDNQKAAPVKEWECVERMGKVIQTKLHALLVECDQNVGTFDPESDVRKGGKQAFRLAKSKRDEVLYVKYVRARESVQSKILLLSHALKDPRLDLQVKKNSIGHRDFKLDLQSIRKHIEGGDSRNEKKPRSVKSTQARRAGRSVADEEETGKGDGGGSEEPPAKKARQPRKSKK